MNDPGQLPPRNLTGRERGLVLTLSAVIGTVLGLVAWQVAPLTPAAPSAPAATSTAAATPSLTTTAVTLGSYDPLPGGSGFRLKGDSWTTQTYQGSPAFGGTKPGVGLVLDLGSAKPVGAVTFTVVEGPIAVELRAGDAAPTSPTSLASVGAKVSATGATRLTVANGGSHRYWMIWVTQLAPVSGGYRAVIKAPAALTKL